MQKVSTFLQTILSCSFFMAVTLTTHAQEISVSEIASAEKMAGLQFTPAQRDSMVNQLNYNLKIYQYLHGFDVQNSVPLPQWFDPVLPQMVFPTKQDPIKFSIPAKVAMPADTNQLAFYSIAQLSS